MKSRDDKIKIMEKKNALKGTRIYINDDLTAEERDIQKVFKSMVINERKNGKKAKLGFKKIYVEGEWVKWDALQKKNSKQS